MFFSSRCCLPLLLLLISFALYLSTTVKARTITDALGQHIMVPDQIQRPVAISETDLDALIALGFQPVGTTAGRGQNTVPHYLGATGRQTPLIGGFAAPVLDKIIAVRPDLILAGGITDPKRITQLQKIAPTVVTYTPASDWKHAFKSIAYATGKDKEAEIFLERYKKRMIQIRSKLGPHQHDTISIVRWNPRGPAYMLADAFSSLVVKDLGLQRPPTQNQAGQAHSPPLNLEALARIDGDWLFIGTLGATSQQKEAFKAAMQKPVFTRLQAVQNHRVRFVDGSLWTSVGGPLGAMAVLDDIEQAMTGGQ